TTALREPRNYGLRGWISTRSSFRARVFFEGDFERRRTQAVWQGGGRAASPAIRRNALGYYQGSASGMKMSMGQTGRRLLGFAVAGVALVACGAAYAEMGQPAPWEYKLQESASPVMDNITWFHNFLFVLITVIPLFVLALLVIVVVKFNAKA